MIPTKTPLRLATIILSFLTICSGNLFAEENCNSVNLTAKVLTFECQNNATNSIPSDDFYAIHFNFSKSSEDGETYEFFVNGNSEGFFTYDNIHSVNTGTSDELVSISIVDINSSCVLEQVIGPLYPCSTDCEIFPSILIQACYNNQTDYDISDDIHEFTVQSQAINGSSSFDLVVNGEILSTNPYGALNDFTLPADNSIPSVMLVDSDNNQCNFVIEIEQLIPCSQDCGATINDLNYTCIGNEYNIDFEIEMFNGNSLGKKWIQVDNDTPIEITSSTYSLNLPADDLEHSIMVIDFDADDCFATETIGPLVSCNNEPCAVFASVNSVKCNDNNTSNNEADDFFMAELSISAINGGDTWKDAEGNVFNYGNDIELGPFAIIDGDITLNITDVNNDECFLEIVIEAPSTCSTCNESIDAGIDKTISCYIPEADLVGVSSSIGEYSWKFNGQIISNNLAFTVSEEGWYYFNVNFDNGCSLEDSVYITSIKSQIPEAVINSEDNQSNITCSVKEINLFTSAAPNVVYTWENIQGVYEGLDITVFGADEISLTALDTISGCISEAIFNTTEETTIPSFEIDPTNDLTCINKEVEVSLSEILPESTSQISWYNSSNELISQDESIMVEEIGWFYIENVDQSSDCATMDSVFISKEEEYPILANIEDQMLACNQETTMVEIEVMTNNEFTINWTSADGTILSENTMPEIQVEGEGIYIAEVVDNLTGCMTSTSMEVTKMQSDVELMQLQINDETCESSNGQITNIELDGGTEPYEVSLNNYLVEDLEMIDNLSAGEYDVYITDANGCSFDTSVVISSTEGIELYNEPLVSITEGESDVLLIETTIPTSEIASINWSPTDYLSCSDCLSPTATPLINITYTVTIVSLEDCIATSYIEIELRANTKIYVPNTFSPNDDGINDYFNIFGKGIEQVELLEIFNRWGEKVFSKENFGANNSQDGWNGLYKGQGSNSNVFGYIAKVKMVDGTTELRKGDLTLIK